MHSGSYYIVQRDWKVPDDIMNQAMANFGTEHPGDGKNYCCGKVVYVDYSDRADRGYYDYPHDLDLRISLKTGLAQKTYHEDQAHPATDKELDIVISHLKDSIKRIKHRIVNKMVQN